MATFNGARSAGLFAGVLKAGALPYVIAIDLTDITLCSSGPEDLAEEDLLNHIALSATPAVVRRLAVG